MILADTSIWIDHLRRNDVTLVNALTESRIACHPFVVGEIALGSLKDRAAVLDLLDGLRSLPVAAPAEVRFLVEAHKLYGRGIGYVDASLIASCLIVPGTRLWTRDQRLFAIASELRIEGG